MGAKVATFEQCYNAEKRRRLHSAKIVQTTEFERFTIGGKRISKPQHGVNIIKRMMERLKRS